MKHESVNTPEVRVCLRTSSPAPHGLLCLTVCSSHQMAVCGFVNSNEQVRNQLLHKSENTPNFAPKK